MDEFYDLFDPMMELEASKPSMSVIFGVFMEMVGLIRGLALFCVVAGNSGH